MKKVIVCLLIFCSCNNKSPVPIRDPIEEPIDSLDINIKQRLSDLDSNFYYLGLNHGYALEESQNEALYYKTGEEKYRKAAYASQKKKLEAARKGVKFQERLSNPIDP